MPTTRLHFVLTYVNPKFAIVQGQDQFLGNFLSINHYFSFFCIDNTMDFDISWRYINLDKF